MLNEKSRQANPFAKATIALVIAAAMLFGAVSTAVADDMKIGYVDFQRVLEESNEGQRVKAQLERELNTREQSLEGQQRELMERRQQLEQQAMMLSEERRQQMAMELQQEMYKLQETAMQLQQELAQHEAQATRGLFNQVKSLAQEVGAEKGFTLVIEGGETTVLFAVDGLDLTDEVIERFNARD